MKRKFSLVFIALCATISATIDAASVKNNPTPEDVFQMKKDELKQLEPDVLAKAVYEMCAKSQQQQQNKFTPSKINLIWLNEQENVTLPIERANEMWQNPRLAKNKKIVVFCPGFLRDRLDRDDATETMLKGFRNRRDANLFALDTSKEIDTLAKWANFDTEVIGRILGKALLDAKKAGISTEQIHLIGHSVGAAVAGAAGREFQRKCGQSLKRITGLDHINPCFGFNNGDGLTGLFRGDAEQVDVIHTNNAVFGKREPLGDVDCFANGAVSRQDFLQGHIDSHELAYKIFAATVPEGSENKYMATKCNSMKDLKSGNCKGKPTIPVGLITPPKKGNFVFEIRTIPTIANGTNSSAYNLSLNSWPRSSSNAPNFGQENANQNQRFRSNDPRNSISADQRFGQAFNSGEQFGTSFGQQPRESYSYFTSEEQFQQPNYRKNGFAQKTAQADYRSFGDNQRSPVNQQSTRQKFYGNQDFSKNSLNRQFFYSNEDNSNTSEDYSDENVGARFPPMHW